MPAFEFFLRDPLYRVQGLESVNGKDSGPWRNRSHCTVGASSDKTISPFSSGGVGTLVGNTHLASQGPLSKSCTRCSASDRTRGSKRWLRDLSTLSGGVDKGAGRVGTDAHCLGSFFSVQPY
jgi:hypothetical protein